ncbi:MAG: energy-coupling factor transporter transmembrane component T family protein, partial [Anaerolineae bacterium]
MSEFEFLRDVTIGQYLPTDSPLHRLDPRAKLLMIVIFLAGGVASASLTALFFALTVVMGTFVLARIPARYALRGVRPALPLLILLALLQIVTFPQNDVGQVLWKWWRITVTLTDLHVAALLLVRFLVLILGISLLSMVTTTAELTHGIEHLLRPLQRF